VNHEVFSLTPGSFIDDWTPGQSSDEWMERKLKKPAMAHVQATRTEPPLEELVSDVVDLIRHHGDGNTVPQVSKAQLMERIKDLSNIEQNGEHVCYTLQAVYQALSGPGIYSPAADHDKFLDTVATALLQAVPTPTIEIADTHRESSNKPGSTERLGVLYNPFRDAINLHIMDDAHDGHAPARTEWIKQPWSIMTTPSHDIDHPQSTGQ
jgi:hypothetical protein